jgi:nitrate/nitrite-specific signal transduction histidine kinase
MTAMELLRECYEIQGKNFDKAGEVSGEIKVVLRDLGIDAAHLRRLVIVAFEAEMNVVMYAQRGTMTLIVTDEDINLEITDEGPGIPDMKKNSDEFRIESNVGKGTSVFSKIRLPAHE